MFVTRPAYFAPVTALIIKPQIPAYQKLQSRSPQGDCLKQTQEWSILKDMPEDKAIILKDTSLL